MKIRNILKANDTAIYLLDSQYELLLPYLKDRRVGLYLIEDIDWENDLTIWPAKNIFRSSKTYGGNALEFYASLKQEIIKDNIKYHILAGISLAALFGLYISTIDDFFTGIIAISPSLWYEGFTDYWQDHRCYAKKLYMSLGNREKDSKNKIFKHIEDDFYKTIEIAKTENIELIYELNEGKHFDDPAGRLLKGIKAYLN